MVPSPPVSRDDRRQFFAVLLLWALVGVFLVTRKLWFGGGMEFLVWNGFLAVIPLGLAWLARRHAARGWAVLGLGLAWLVFMPNAPYLLTDLMHLRTSRVRTLPLDVFLLASAAAAGTLAGLVSLRWMHEALLRRGVRRWVGWGFVGAASVAAGFGVYLGRFQRWNSWDILSRPSEVLSDAWSALGEMRVFGYAALLGLGLCVGYAVLTLFVGSPGAEHEVRPADVQKRSAGADESASS